MRSLLALALLLLLPACVGQRYGVLPTPTIERDWSQFTFPPDGTPCSLRVFFVPRPHRWARRIAVVDLPGAWGSPGYRASFPMWRSLNNVVRVEVHFEGEVISSTNFGPPINFTKGRTVGWKR